jgi:hypothetical protein
LRDIIREQDSFALTVFTAMDTDRAIIEDDHIFLLQFVATTSQKQTLIHRGLEKRSASLAKAR